MEGQTRIAAEQPEHLDDNIDGHEKKSMFHNVKDRVRKLNAKVKKSYRARQGHEETPVESGEEEEEEEDDEAELDQDQDRTGGKSDENVGDVTKAFAGLDTNEKQDMPKNNEGTMRIQNNPHILNDNKHDIPTEETMKAREDPNEDLSPSKETEQGRGERVNAVPITEMEETETKVTIPSIPRKAGEVVAEPTESSSQDKVSEDGEGNELASNTKPPNVTEEVKSDAPETAPGVMSKASGLAQGFMGAFALKQSSNDNAKDTVLQGEREGIEDGGPQQQQNEAGGVVNAKENLEEFGSHSGPNSVENLEEKSQGLSEQALDKVSDVGEGNESASDTKPTNVTEEVKSGASETGPGFMSKASSLGQGFKDGFTRKQTSNDNVKDSVLEGEREGKKDEGPQHQQSEAGGVGQVEKPEEEESQNLAEKTQDKASEVGEGKEDEGTRQLQSEAEAKAGLSYAQKLYAAKAAIGSKLGYGGQTNQENNVTRELKSDGTGTEAMEGAKESKKSPVVSKMSPGEDEKALSTAITDAISNIVGGFYGGKEKSSTTTDTTMGASQSPPQSPSSNASGGKGIVGRVTGVVGSFVGKKKGEDGEVSPSSQKQEPNSVVQVEEQMAVQPKGKSELQNEESTPMEQ